MHGLCLQTFVDGLCLAAEKLNTGQARPHAELRAAIYLQRRLLAQLCLFDPETVSGACREISGHNTQFPADVVLTAHQDMLVRA